MVERGHTVVLAVSGRRQALMSDGRAIVAFFRDQNGDVVLITPVINFHSSQNALIRGAVAAGYPTALLVHSWDNLTNKGLVQHAPDRVLVWNDAQKKEAVELQGIEPNRVVVTGAQSYDQW